MDKESLVTLTADIVASHVSKNSVAIADIGNLIQRVHVALAGLGSEAGTEAESRKPVVSVRSSVKPNVITCLICGANQTILKRHISNAHGLTPAEYRADFGLPASYPMVAPNYSARRSELAKSIGLGRKKASSNKASTDAKTG